MTSPQNGFYPKHLLSQSYSTLTRLNTLDVHLPDPSSTAAFRGQQYWIIYIHGGAWRDPSSSSAGVLPTLEYLSPAELPIAGVASLNYRLSPYPHHGTDPSSPDDPARNAQHPAHIEDVLTAIEWLQRKYEIGNKYVVVGHSCGATLAFQVVMRKWLPPGETADGDAMKLPVAVIGVEGIYDLRMLEEKYSAVPMYHQFLEAAFGPIMTQWDAASPTDGKFSEGWIEGKLTVLAHSDEDQLVDWGQVERMQATLKREQKDGRKDVIFKLQGDHNEIWAEGKELAKAIKYGLSLLISQ
ncbi:MAG: hypothetical protein MMC33_007202 [Icmadophila ericetorum]|nr:hypothetical protein [Icmadophila ericetorum]